MAWTAPRTWVAGETVTAALLNTHVRDNLKAIGDAWTAYGSGASWTAATTNPSLGNGTWAGFYTQVGQWVRFRTSITMGSTTTFGSGVWSIALPVAPLSILNTVGAGVMFDTSASLIIPINWFGATGSTIKASRYDGTQLAHNGPLVWATGDAIRFAGEYEAA